MTSTALIVVDMLNSYDHPDSEPLQASAAEAVPYAGELIEHAHRTGQPVVYVNDNIGEWRSDQAAIVTAARAGRRPDLVEPVLPDERALFVVKARHSIFYQTPLEYLLRQQGIGHLVLCGQVTEQCILYSALDAHVRHLDVTVARDAVAHIDPQLAAAALEMMARNMGVTVCPARDLL
ncbi:cysteine hydrolase family protein [Streptacidiphilus monticola]|uniref:Cysteine hydrolase family protein n=1 Tax=Streptacidiphilus monticola TaxID=2161674 RepID=A0ABW1FVK7_9ACTN